MAYDKVVDSAKLDAGMTATANAIRAKTGGTEKIPWDSATGFKTAVEAIQTGGGTEDLSAELAAQDELISALEEAVANKASGGGGGTAEPPNIQPLSVTSNGTYTASGDVDGYSPIVVAVPEKTPVLQPLTVTKNGTYEPEEGISGFSPVTVNVPTPKPVLESLTVNANGTYTPSAGTDGYSSVIVNVPSSGGGGGAQIQTGEFTLSADATQYTVSGLPFRPKWFAVKGSDFGSAGVARTVYWQKNDYTGETVTCSHKGTNSSLTTVLGTAYAAFGANGFTIKQYLQLPIVAGTYTWVAATDE